MSRPKIKICGITNLIDAKNALNLGADYIGFINIEYSLRYLPEADIKVITKDLTEEELEKTVLLTDSESTDEIIQTSSHLGIKTLQLYSNLSNSEISTLKSLGYTIFKPISIDLEDDIDEIDYFKNYVHLMILDTKSKENEAAGGTGRVFNWDIYNKAKEHYHDVNLALAGGLNPDNIMDAISKTNPYMLDISSGLESKPRIKSLEKMKALFDLVQAAV